MSLFVVMHRRYLGTLPANQTDWDIRFLYLEILFASILGGIVTFNSAFAIRLGASKDLVAWLSAAPALIGAIASIPSARFFAQRRKRKLWMFGSLLIYRAGYLVVAFMPLFIPIQLTATAFVIWIVALNLPAIFFSNGWTTLLGELIPEKRRAFVVSRRTIIYSVGMVLVSALAGAWLDKVAFPENYQIMYAFGFVAVLGSSFYLNRLTVPDHEPPAVDLPVAQLPKERMVMTPSMRNMLINMGVYSLGLNLLSSLVNIFYIENLMVSDGWIGLNAAAANAGVIVGYIIWERLLRRHSFIWGQRRAALFTWTFPVVLALVPNLFFIMLSNFFVNVMHSGVDLANFNVLLKQTHPKHHTEYVSLFNAVTQAAAFVGPLVGTWIAIRYGIPAALLASGALRLGGGLLFTFNHVNEMSTETPLATHN